MIYILAAFGLCFLDKGLKAYIEKKITLGQQKEIMGKRLILTKYYNKGAFLNLLENKPNFLLAFSVFLFGVLLGGFFSLLRKPGESIFKLGAACLTGGGLSNVTDRIQKRHVVDYFCFQFQKPKWLKGINHIVFNLGDMAIFMGSFLIMISAIFEKGHSRT